MSEKSLPATQENVNNAICVIDRQRGGGGTELLPALNRCLPSRSLRLLRSIIVVTDGYVRVEEEVFDLIRANLNDATCSPSGSAAR
jgi:Ca-activated chloride channel family protein